MLFIYQYEIYPHPIVHSRVSSLSSRENQNNHEINCLYSMDTTAIYALNDSLFHRLSNPFLATFYP